MKVITKMKPKEKCKNYYPLMKEIKKEKKIIIYMYICIHI